MNRRTFLMSLAASPLLLEMLTACGSSESRSGDEPNTKSNEKPDTQGLVRSNRARVEGSGPTVSAAATNAFGAKLLAALHDTHPNANLVCSPLSVAAALAMTVAGAKGRTRDEMAAVLGYDVTGSVDDSLDAFLSSMNSLLAGLAARHVSHPEVQLNIANAVWGQSGEVWSEPFLDVLAEQFGTGVETVDFKTDAEGARTRINTWVEQQTHDQISDLLAKGELDELTRLVLVNAVYLKADWEKAFDPNDTDDRDFSTDAGSTVQVPMMHRDGFITHAVGDGWKAVELPYVFGELRMVAVVTDDANIAAPSIDTIVEQLDDGPVLLSLPRFDFETKISLRDTLSQMGMPTAFSDSADFSGMTQTEPLKIGNVIHQANITTGEKGTEAAAATSVELEYTMGVPPEEDEVEPTVIRFNRPFSFWLRDEPTGAVIFAGSVSDPSK